MTRSSAGRALRTGSTAAAKTLGRIGGKSRSVAKIKAARINGKKNTGD